MRNRRKWLTILAALAALSLVAAACGDDDGDTTGTTGATGETTTEVTGSLNISGSSTVEPITSLVAEQFQGQNPGGARSRSTDRAPATGSSCSATVRRTSAMPRGRSRRRRSTACSENGIEPIEIEVALDALTRDRQSGEPRTSA